MKKSINKDFESEHTLMSSNLHMTKQSTPQNGIRLLLLLPTPLGKLAKAIAKRKPLFPLHPFRFLLV